MDITINRIVVPAVSRNGRIYNNEATRTTSTAAGGAGGTTSASQYWTQTGGTLAPATAGDIVYVAADNPSGYVLIGTNANATGSGVSGVAGGSGAGVEGASASGYGVNGTSTSSVGVRGVSSSNFGVYGQSSTSHGVSGYSTSANGGYFSSSSGTGVTGSSTTGIGAYFQSGSNTGVWAYSTSGIAVLAQINPSSTNNAAEVLRLYRTTSGTAANGIGAAINYYIENGSGTTSLQGSTSIILTNASSGSESSSHTITLRDSGGALAEVSRLSGAGELWTKQTALGTTVFTPLSTMDVIGSQSEEWRLQTGASTTLSINDRSIICDTSSNAITVNLPNATTCSRRTYIIRRYTGGNNVTIDPYSSQTILGSTGSFSTLDLTNNGEWVMLTSNGADWYVLASNPNF